MLIEKLDRWYKFIQKRDYLKIKIKKINDLKGWTLNNFEVCNNKKYFFNINFFKVNIGKNTIYTPLICQKETGILGIIKSKINLVDKYLLQAKTEPGNVNRIQISPTVQATKSNYTRKHNGKITPYLNFFLKKKKRSKLITKIYQMEQGTRYKKKYNQNILIEVKDYKNIKIKDNFRWFSKNEIFELLKEKNLLNMDTLSIFSCSIKKKKIDKSLLSLSEINKMLKIYKKEKLYRIKKINLNNLNNWIFKFGKIFNKKENFFSIIGINVKTNSREIDTWDQPIIKDNNIGFIGLITKEFYSNLHYLLKIVQEPGYDFPVLTTTINSKNIISKKASESKFFSHFKNKKNVIFDQVLSDEGGRFFHNQNRNVVIKMSLKKFSKPKHNYIWVSHNQLVDLIKNKAISIELRNLFACLNIQNIK